MLLRMLMGIPFNGDVLLGFLDLQDGRQCTIGVTAFLITRRHIMSNALFLQFTKIGSPIFYILDLQHRFFPTHLSRTYPLATLAKSTHHFVQRIQK
jgi:hypothetical protein